MLCIYKILAIEAVGRTGVHVVTHTHAYIISIIIL